MAVAYAGNCSSDLTPGLGTPYAKGVVLKRKKEKKETNLVGSSLQLSVLRPAAESPGRDDLILLDGEDQ